MEGTVTIKLDDYEDLKYRALTINFMRDKIDECSDEELISGCLPPKTVDYLIKMTGARRRDGKNKVE